MNRREASKMETRRLIMAAAKKLLQKIPVEECTMRRIAKEAGVSAASVVVHFKNKYALLEATLGKDIERTTDQAIATLPSGGDLAERVVHIWHAMYAFYDTNRNLYRTLIRNTVFEPEDQTPFLTWHTDTFLKFLQELIDKEKEDGRLANSVDSATMAMVFFSLYFGTLILFYRSPAMTPLQAGDLVAAGTRQALAGLTLNKGRR